MTGERMGERQQEPLKGESLVRVSEFGMSWVERLKTLADQIREAHLEKYPPNKTNVAAWSAQCETLTKAVRGWAVIDERQQAAWERELEELERGPFETLLPHAQHKLMYLRGKRSILDSGVVPKAELDATTASFNAELIQWAERLAAAERAREEAEREARDLRFALERKKRARAHWKERADALTAEFDAAESENAELRRVGDLMQSSLSRLSAWNHPQKLPYEVRMAVMGGATAIEDWTAARSALTRSQSPASDPDEKE